MCPRSPGNIRRSLAEWQGDAAQAEVTAKPGTTPEDLRRDRPGRMTMSNLWNAFGEPFISIAPNARCYVRHSGDTTGSN
jgi:hypothetical protein